MRSIRLPLPGLRWLLAVLTLVALAGTLPEAGAKKRSGARKGSKHARSHKAKRDARPRRNEVVRLGRRGRPPVAKQPRQPSTPPAVPVTDPVAAPTTPVAPAPEPAATLAERLFAPDSFWNALLANNAPLTADSASLVAELKRSVDRDIALKRGPWINVRSYSTPIYKVPADQPTVRVKLDQWNPALQAAFDAVPIPPGAIAAAGTDANMVVWQPATDSMWEFWLMKRQTDGWHARWGGKMTGVSTNEGRYPNNWGAPATSLPQIGGTITIEEMRSGRIPHALAMAVPEPKRGVFVWPARRTDGWSDRPEAIPEGTRFRLDPALDLSKLALPRATRILAEAAQRYGMVVRDKSANVALYGEDPTPTGTDPWPALFGGLPPNKILQAFPWARLQALAPPPGA
jgi:hypothetical protein